VLLHVPPCRFLSNCPPTTQLYTLSLHDALPICSLVPTWKLIATVVQHDQYHAGQIHMQRAILAPSSTPPPPEGELWKKYCEGFRSEEHTSELQSRENLVCRLLLEKKKEKTTTTA